MGLTKNADGYLRIKSGEHRDKYAHRAYAERQLGRPLHTNEQIHHDCRNKECWPPTDFHLVIMQDVLHDGSSGGNKRHWEKRK